MPERASPGRVAIIRGVAFFALWLALIQSVKVTDLAIGACATLAATWLSLHLLPPAAGRLRVGILCTLLPHLLWESVRAGVDVARRALSPQPNLKPGIVTCPLDLPPGQARNTFATITSLLPGTLACGEVDGVLTYHCLDITQPVVKQLQEEERRLAGALVRGESHG
ncbi:MAG: Na+/H+ antiporter subunit E [Halieaceae bacterium]|jgi:multicomponent Na+:H+ antiporter subunit E|nr:Na+/H+ antiporter subunit E [Halieaceae bacterium]